MQIPTYTDYRRQILEAALTHKLRVHSIEFDRGPDGERIFSDIISTPIDSDKPTYIFSCGCHGVEGYLGSLILRKYLQTLANDQLAKMNLVIIHPICPYGMAWYRRVNSQNIDLNRNFFTTTDRPVNRGFEAVLPLLNSRNPVEFAIRLFKTIWKEGYVATRRILGMGQYEFPEQPFYGGLEVQEEILQIFGYLKDLLHDVPQITVCDIHTGLGKKGEEMIFGLTENETHSQELQKHYPDKNFINLKNESWEPSGTLQHAVSHFFQNTKVNFMVQEFGTVPSIFVLYALMQDQQKFASQKTDPQRINRMLKAFFISDPQVQNLVVAKALRTLNIVTEAK